MAAFAQNPGIQIEIGVDDIQASGDMAHTNGTWSTFEGETLQNEGKFLGVYARQADGSWQAKIDSSNTNSPPPAEEGS